MGSRGRGVRAPLPSFMNWTWGRGQGRGEINEKRTLLSPALSSLGGRRGRRRCLLGGGAKMRPDRREEGRCDLSHVSQRHLEGLRDVLSQLTRFVSLPT